MEKERRSKWSVFMIGVLLIVGVMCSVVPVRADTSADAFQIYYKGNGQEYTGIIIHRYKGTESNVIIPSTIEGLPVVQIDKEAFKGCDQVVSVTIPINVTEIGESAFKDCRALQHITIPNSVIRIWRGAFEGCSSLKEIALPDSVNQFGEYVFRNCTGLQKIVIPSETGCITDEMFAGCSNLKEVSISVKVHTIRSSAFYGCANLETLQVDSKNITYYSNQNCIIERSAKNLILGCKNSVIPDGVKWINYRAFYGCNGMKEVKIPQSVSSISEEAFYACHDLETLTVDDENERYYSEGNCIITNDRKVLVLGCKQSVIPEGVVTIGHSAFANCTELENITIPSSVSLIQYNAFSNCTKLKKIYIPKSVTSLRLNEESSSGNVFDGCNSLEEIEVEAGNTM